MECFISRILFPYALCAADVILAQVTKASVKLLRLNSGLGDEPLQVIDRITITTLSDCHQILHERMTQLL